MYTNVHNTDSLFQSVFCLEQLLDLALALLILHHQGVDVVLQLSQLSQGYLDIFALKQKFFRAASCVTAFAP